MRSDSQAGNLDSSICHPRHPGGLAFRSSQLPQHGGWEREDDQGMVAEQINECRIACARPLPCFFREERP